MRKALTRGKTVAAPSAPATIARLGSAPSVALALGGGGARGLAHILMLEAFDELGVKPKVIAGTSIGAIFGAAYASGLTGRQLRAHTEEVLGARLDLVRELFTARARNIPKLWNVFSARSALLAPDVLLDLILPSRVARDFSRLDIPLKIIATDFYGLDAAVFSDGPLRRAIAASMALPVIFEPVVVEGRALIDGGLVNPLPFDVLTGEADIVVAIDVSGMPTPTPDRDVPSATEALFASAFIFERTIVREKLRSEQPDIYIHAGTGQYQVLDFLKVKDILAAAEPAKARLKQQLARVLGAETVEEETGGGGAIAPPPETPRPRLLKRLTAPRRGRKET